MKPTPNVETKSKRTHQGSPEIMTAQEAADYLQVSVKTLENLRVKRGGPVYTKAKGVGIRYLKSDLDGYIQQSRVRHLPQPRA